MNTNEGLNVDLRLVTGLQVDKDNIPTGLGSNLIQIQMNVNVFFLLEREQLLSLGTLSNADGNAQ